MKTVLPGTKPPKIPRIWQLSEYLPDRRRPAAADVRSRNLYSKGAQTTQHTTLAVNDTVTQTVDELQRIRAVQVGTVTGGTVTVQVQVEGRDIFDDTVRPVSGGAVQEATDIYTFPAGSPVSTIIEATSGVPTGNANIIIETEPYILFPNLIPMPLRGRGRLRMSRRREQRLAEAGQILVKAPRLGSRTARPEVRGSDLAAGQQAQLEQTQPTGSRTPQPKYPVGGRR